MNRKIIFFDIDGTLWDFNNYIPESTVLAVKRARANGHLAFINSGRTRAFIRNEELMSIGFDGIVSGCGTCVEQGDETVFYHRLDNDMMTDVVKALGKFHFRPILEGRHKLYIRIEDFNRDDYGVKLIDEMGDDLLDIDECWGDWEISKLSCATEWNMHSECMDALAGLFDFVVHSPTVVEMVPKGFSKGTGIEKVCEYYGIDIADTIAIGDSNNDLGMFEAAGVSVAMGSGAEEARDAADIVTRALHDDGIYHALEGLDII